MTDEIPLYNSRIIKVFLEYTKKHYPAIDIDVILGYAKINKHEVEDPACWFNQSQTDRFYEILAEKTGNPDIAREAGRYTVLSSSTTSLKALKQYLLGLMNLISIFLLMEKVYAFMSRGAVIKVKKLGPNKVEVVATPKRGVNEKPYQCENRWGSFESLPKLFTNKYASIKHPSCFHKGDESCRYIISWEISPSLVRKKIRNYFLLLGIPASIIFLAFLPFMTWLVFFLLLVCLDMGLSFYSEYLEKKELSKTIENQGDAAKDLLDEINIRHDNAMLIKEIGNATSSILDITELINSVAKTMEKYLDFDRGLIMLAEENNFRLVYTAGYGYTSDQEELLQQTDFHLDKSESKGAFVVAFKQQQPLLINDIFDKSKNLSQRSYELAKEMGVRSLVCVPIIYKKESLGIVAVDNMKSKRALAQSDLSLLTGIASQTAVSIMNARAFQKLNQSEKKYRELVEEANSIILRIDVRGNITFFNEFAQKIFGLAENEVLGMNLAETIFPDNETAKIDLENRIKSFQKDPELQLVSESENVLKNGQIVWIAWTYKPTFDNKGNFKEILCIGNDITPSRRAEQEKKALEDQLRRAQKMEAIGTLAGGVAHDLNNILSGIVSYPELLLMDLPKDSPLRQPLLTIQKAGERAAAIVQDLLTMSRGAISITEVVNLNRIIHDYLKSPEHEKLQFHYPEVELETRLDANLLNILGSPVHLTKTIMNLIYNAAESIPAGGKICMSTENRYLDWPIRGYDYVKAGDYITLTVVDTGIGIAPKDLDRIFEPFYTTKTMGKSGTGLGLAVIWGTVKDHHGYIEVKSIEGKGTTFILYFPITREEFAVEKAILSMAEYKGKGESILVVDDMPEQREIASYMLTKLGYSVASVSSGEGAIDYIKENPVDLVVLDMIMNPGIDGLETYKRILEVQPGQKAIIASGFSESSRVKDAQQLGAGEYIKKPYLLEKIGMAVRKELDR